MQDEIQNMLAQQLQLHTESELEEELSTILSSFKPEGEIYSIVILYILYLNKNLLSICIYFIHLDELNLPEVPSMDLLERKQNEDKKSDPVKFALAE